ncbi:AAA family ATPase [Enterobacter asburiae]|uniref:AAA family ATPase n=1 Tax=Enterobacter asburiae TaxID=61645 RepID=UPI00294BA957|nr:AAA family ATPase [Enterobacter asburiae]HAS0908363.1 AAA family ATPase [Enterobacter cloacae]HED6255136.1 AAA family ATPase [Enterobacter cloacae]
MNLELKRFSIKKLYGYKDVELIFNGKSTIIIAENGAGKTTLINALKSTLKGEIDELRKVRCESIEIEIGNKKYIITIAELGFSDFLSSSFVPPSYELLVRYLSSSQVDDLLSFTRSRPVRDAKNTTWYDTLHRRSPYARSDIDQMLTELKRAFNRFYSSHNESDLFSSDNSERTESTINLEKIKKITSDIDIIYLPTYRRIEKATLRDRFNREENDRFALVDGEMVKMSNSQPSSSNIEFGLYDVESKLKEISSSIERRSSLGYRSLSATIIEDMMTGKINALTRPKLPSISELSRFLGRVVNKDKEENKRIIEEVTSIMESKEQLANNKMLNYFLSKLKGVIDSTKELELKIESFVEICNKYLQLSDDSKSLNYDVESLQVIVKDVFTNNPIELEDLSSGEKQIISLMAHMYLDHTKKKIVLIDEPELSLSLEWQEHVLVDIANSPSVLQLLAITHSPFVFNNDLKSEVKTLNVKKYLASDKK